MAEQGAKERTSAVRCGGRNACANSGAWQDIMDRMAEELFEDWPMLRVRPFEWRMEQFSPSIDIVEGEKEFKIEAELPGMNPDDLDISLTRDAIVLQGEKKAEEEEEREGVCYSERCYGSFQRVIPLPDEVDRDKVEAQFRNGVLSVTLPKSERVIQQRRKIEIKGEGKQAKQG
jgi:HSP20 family protein